MSITKDIGIKNFTVGELFTDAELDAAFDTIHKHFLLGAVQQECGIVDPGPTRLTDKLVAEIIDPAMSRIEQTTGQPNDARYLAYVLQYAYSKTVSERPKQTP